MANEEKKPRDTQPAVSSITPFEMIAAAIITNAIVTKMPDGEDPIQNAKQVYTRMLRYVGRVK